MRKASPGAFPPPPPHGKGASIPSQQGRKSLWLADKCFSAFRGHSEALSHGPEAEG